MQCPTNPINRKIVSTSVARAVNKVFYSAEEAIADLEPNTTVLAGGFGLCGVPDTLIEAVKNKPSITGLTVVSNNAGTDEAGLGLLLASKQIRKMISSFVGDNKTFERQYLSGELELELTPQGTLVERCRAGGAGIPAFFTPSGYGTAVQMGELPLRYNPDGTIAAYTTPRDVKIFDGKPYVMEEAIKGDYAFVKAWKADTLGNCQFRYSAWNLNAAMGRAAKCTIVEAEHIVEPGEIDPSAVHLPGIFVKRVIQSTAAKNIERLIYAKESGVDMSILGTGKTAIRRERIVRRVAKEFKHGMYVNLGIGMPMLAPTFVDPAIDVQMQSENGVLGVGGYPRKGEEDADIIVAGKWPVTLRAGAACFSTEDSFAMIRSGRIDMTILGAMQVSARGDLANCELNNLNPKIARLILRVGMLPGKVKGFGGAMDLVSNPTTTKVVVLTEHVDKHGQPKIVKQCEFPLTGKTCVSRIITDLVSINLFVSSGSCHILEDYC